MVRAAKYSEYDIQDILWDKEQDETRLDMKQKIVNFKHSL